MLNTVTSGAPFLDEAAGKEFTEKLWAETVAEVTKLDPSLGSYA